MDNVNFHHSFGVQYFYYEKNYINLMSTSFVLLDLYYLCVDKLCNRYITE